MIWSCKYCFEYLQIHIFQIISSLINNFFLSSYKLHIWELVTLETCVIMKMVLGNLNNWEVAIFWKLYVLILGNCIYWKLVFGKVCIWDVANKGNCMFGKLLLGLLCMEVGNMLFWEVAACKVAMWVVTTREIVYFGSCHLESYFLENCKGIESLPQTQISYPFIFTTECTKPLIFQIYRLIYLTEFSFYPMSKTLDCKHLRKDNQTLWQRLL